MNKLIEHIKATGIDLPTDITDHQLAILCEVVIRACDQYIIDNSWAEPGELLEHFGVEE